MIDDSELAHPTMHMVKSLSRQVLPRSGHKTVGSLDPADCR